MLIFFRKYRTYISMFYMLAKSFREKPNCFVLYVKRTKFEAKKLIFGRYFFIFFIHDMEKS
jgi:hypothetical protein